MKFKSLNIQDSFKMIQDGAIIVDVREEDEFNQSHIENSILIPLSRINAQRLHELNPDNKKIILHCRSGKRSKLAANILINQNYRGEILEMNEGIIGWIDAKLPVFSNN